MCSIRLFGYGVVISITPFCHWGWNLGTPMSSPRDDHSFPVGWPILKLLLNPKDEKGTRGEKLRLGPSQ